MARTLRNDTCPICGKQKSTEHVAMLSLFDKPSGIVVEPHQYAVCHSCYGKQRQRFYAARKKGKVVPAVIGNLSNEQRKKARIVIGSPQPNMTGQTR